MIGMSMNKEPPTTKVCKVCAVEKDISEFNKSVRKSRDTIEYSAKCKDCFRTTRIRNEGYDKSYHKNNKERIKERGKLYRENNREEIKRRKREYYRRNKTEIRARRALIYATNEGVRLAKIRCEKDRYAREGDKIRARTKKHRADNKETYNAKLAKRRKEDVNFGLKHTVSNSIRNYLRSGGGTKNGSVLKYLPYSFEELKAHLEKQFEPWMTWENRGVYNSKEWDDNNPATWKWNIDHVVPHSTFHYASMEDDDFKKCWALDNLRPLSAKQNILDGTRRSRHGD
jgi:hypothetical protein